MRAPGLVLRRSTKHELRSQPYVRLIDVSYSEADIADARWISNQPQAAIG